jgi:hypothetical protein
VFQHVEWKLLLWRSFLQTIERTSTWNSWTHLCFFFYLFLTSLNLNIVLKSLSHTNWRMKCETIVDFREPVSFKGLLTRWNVNQQRMMNWKGSDWWTAKTWKTHEIWSDDSVPTLTEKSYLAVVDFQFNTQNKYGKLVDHQLKIKTRWVVRWRWLGVHHDRVHSHLISQVMTHMTSHWTRPEL